MNAELLAERNAFKRKAMAMPTVENKKTKKGHFIFKNVVKRQSDNSFISPSR